MKVNVITLRPKSIRHVEDFFYWHERLCTIFIAVSFKSYCSFRLRMRIQSLFPILVAMPLRVDKLLRKFILHPPLFTVCQDVCIIEVLYDNSPSSCTHASFVSRCITTCANALFWICEQPYCIVKLEVEVKYTARILNPEDDFATSVKYSLTQT